MKVKFYKIVMFLLLPLFLQAGLSEIAPVFDKSKSRKLSAVGDNNKLNVYYFTNDGSNLYLGYRDFQYKTNLFKYDGNSLTYISVVDDYGWDESVFYLTTDNSGNFYFDIQNENEDVSKVYKYNSGSFANPIDDTNWQNYAGYLTTDNSGKIYFRYKNSSAQYKMFKYDGSNFTAIENSGWEDGIKYLTRDSSGNMYFAYKNSSAQYKMFKYDGSSFTAIENSGWETDIYYLTTDNSGNIYFKYKNSSNKYQIFKYNGTNLIAIENSSWESDVDYLTIDSNSNIYFKYENSSGKYKLFKYDGNNLTAIDNSGWEHSLYYLTKDNSGNIYLKYVTQEFFSFKYKMFKYDGTNLIAIENSGWEDKMDYLTTDSSGNFYISYGTKQDDVYTYAMFKYDGTNFTVIEDSDWGKVDRYLTTDNRDNIYFSYKNNGKCQIVKYDGSSFTAIENDEDYWTNNYISYLTTVNDSIYFSYSNDALESKLFKYTIPPTINSISNVTINEDSGDYNITINGISEPENRDLNISFDFNDSSIISYTLPWGDNNLSVNDYNNTDLNITITPLSNKFGVVKANVTVYNGTEKVSKNFNITINSVNDKPLWTLEDNSTNEDTNLVIDLSKYVSDLEGNTSMLYGAESNDSSLATVSVSGSTLTITPIENKNGIVGVTAHVFDGEVNSSKSIKVTIIGVNDKPTATNVDINGTVANSRTLTASYTFVDVDGDSESGTTFKWYRADDNSGTNVSAINGATSKEYTLISSDVGKYIKVSITPRDGTEFGDEVNSSYSTIVRDLASWSLENNTTKEDEVLQIDLSKYATDPEGNTSMIYGAESNDTSLATVIVTNSMLSVIPVKDKSGIVGVTAHVFDGDGNSSKTIKVTITAVEDNPTSTETNTSDGGFALLDSDINEGIKQDIINYGGYDYVAFSDSNNGNKLSVYKRVNGSENWSDVISTNISENSITAIYDFFIDGSGEIFVIYEDSVNGEVIAMYDGSSFINSRGLKKKRALGTNWSNISPPSPFNTGKYATTITDRANNIYVAFQDRTNDINRSMLMRYDGANWENLKHSELITKPAEGETNYFSVSNAKDFSMVVDSANTLYLSHIDKVAEDKEVIVIQTYSTGAGFNYHSDGTKRGFISVFKPKAKRAMIDLNTTDGLHIAYITDENNLSVMDYNGSWNYMGTQSIVDNVVSTELGFAIDKNSVPYVAFIESSATSKIKIKKYVDSSWSDVDTISASGVVNNLSIIKDSVGNPYISFNDEGDNNNSKIYFLERYKTLTLREDNLSVGAVNISADTSLTFSLSGGDSSLFDINSSGYIKVKSKLDYENPIDSNKDNYYEFNVSATDVNSKVARVFVKVKVEDLNNSAISDIEISNSTIAENSSSGTKVGDLNITAVDSDGNIEYKLCDDTTTNGIFTISNASVLTATSLDYETTSSYKLCIKATDLGTTASYEENLTISVTDVSETTTSSSSGGGFSGGTSVVETNDRFSVNTSSGLQKNTTETNEAKIIETTETILSGGESSKTIIEIPKDKKATTLKAFVEVTNNSQTTKTMLQTEEGVDVSIGSDKSITSKVSNANLEAEVKVNQNAEAEAKIIVQKKIEVTMKSPKGSEVKQESSGRVTSQVSLKAITKTGVNPVEVKMSAEVEGNLVASAKITNDNREVTTYSLSLPNNVLNGEMELIASESDTNTYTAIKSTFKTSEDFILNPNSKRVVLEGSNIQIIGTTAWQKFEERQYFDGRRTITLLLGGAKLLRDGVEEVMVQNEEYEFTPTDNSSYSISGTTSEVTTLTTLYENSYLTIRYGWNLVTTPIDEELTISSYAIQSYKYSGEWIKNPTTIKPNEGVWVKYSESINEKIEGESYEPIYNNLNSGWNLLGAGRDIALSELAIFSQIWAYDSKVKTWIKNPSTIKRGYGFWVK